MEEQKRKEYIKTTFNTVATGYDSPALRFFTKSANHLIKVFGFNGEEQVLDVATGTGAAALALAAHLNKGRVTGVDFSAGMLAQARDKAAAQNLPNALFMEMDMQTLNFPDNHFDAANCSFGIFFIEDMISQLKHIADKVKPDGTIVACAFYETAFLPIVEKFFSHLEAYGVEIPPLSWKRVGSEEKFIELFENAGLKDIQIHRLDASYHLMDASQWWDVIWYAGFRGLVNQLEPDALNQFKRDHLAEIQQLATNEGIWLDVEVIYAKGKK